MKFLSGKPTLTLGNLPSKFGLTDRNGNDILDDFDNAFVRGYA